MSEPAMNEKPRQVSAIDGWGLLSLALILMFVFVLTIDNRPVPWWMFVYFPAVALLPMLLPKVPRLIVASRKQKVLTFEQRLAGIGRTIRWEDVDRKLSLGQGTLILERHLYKGPNRDWWTSENVLQHSPIRLPHPRELKTIESFEELEAANPQYAEKVYQYYLSPELGKAFLIPRGTSPSLPVPRGCLERRYPNSLILTWVKEIDRFLVLGEWDCSATSSPPR